MSACAWLPASPDSAPWSRLELRSRRRRCPLLSAFSSSDDVAPPPPAAAAASSSSSSLESAAGRGKARRGQLWGCHQPAAFQPQPAAQPQPQPLLEQPLLLECSPSSAKVAIAWTAYERRMAARSAVSPQCASMALQRRRGAAGSGGGGEGSVGHGEGTRRSHCSNCSPAPGEHTMAAWRCSSGALGSPELHLQQLCSVCNRQLEGRAVEAARRRRPPRGAACGRIG